jgi:KilA-N domain
MTEVRMTDALAARVMDLMNAGCADGYINASAMCAAAGKDFDEFYRNEDQCWASYSTHEYMCAVEERTGVPPYDQIRVRKGIIWVHPDVAQPLACWLSPAYAVHVTSLMMSDPEIRHQIEKKLRAMEAAGQEMPKPFTVIEGGRVPNGEGL